MLKPIAFILACQLAGEIIARTLALPVPGPVIGMACLFLALLALGRRARPGRQAGPAPHPGSMLDPGPDGGLGSVADRILAMLGLLFVPAGVGLVDHAGLLAGRAGAFATVLAVSVVATLLVTALVFVGVHRLVKGRSDPA